MAKPGASNWPSEEKPQVRIELDLVDLINLVSAYIPALKKQATFSKRVNWILEHSMPEWVQMATQLQALSDGGALEADVRELSRRLGLTK